MYLICKVTTCLRTNLLLVGSVTSDLHKIAAHKGHVKLRKVKERLRELNTIRITLYGLGEHVWYAQVTVNHPLWLCRFESCSTHQFKRLDRGVHKLLK